jgi:hypothetical protein
VTTASKGAASKVIKAYALLEDYSMKLTYAMEITQAGDIPATEDKGNYYIVRSRRSANRLGAVQEGMLRTVKEALAELRKT